VFGQHAPQDVAGHAAAALRAGREIIAVAQRFREWIASRFDFPGLPPFDVGVGIHTGQVMLFHLSVEGSGDLTAVGDTVNVAARLEAKSKELGWPVVASVATLEHAGEEFRPAEVREVELTGRGAHIAVGRLASLPVSAPRLPERAALYRRRRQPRPLPSLPAIRLRGRSATVAAATARRNEEKNVVLKVLKGRRAYD
jgi:class 3 adenylate cyclase